MEKALSLCELAVQKKPDYGPAHNCLGDIYQKKGQLENAIGSYRKAIQFDPDLKSAWKALFRVEAEIQEEFEFSITKQHLDQAFEYAYEDDTEEALEECEAAKLDLPDIATAHNYLGVIEEMSGQLEPAIESYLMAVELNPRFCAARNNLANARLRWEEEQYLTLSELSLIEEQEISTDFDDSELPETGEPIPQWLYMNKSTFLLAGWPGHRTRYGRSGYDPLESDFELAHVKGIMIRMLLTRKFRTRNPFYILYMSLMGIFFLPCILPFISGDLYGIAMGIAYGPYSIIGILLLMNVFLSLRFTSSDEYEDKGHTFF
jgi:tetratricopeptide (TPR) repeat protein